MHFLLQFYPLIFTPGKVDFLIECKTDQIFTFFNCLTSSMIPSCFNFLFRRYRTAALLFCSCFLSIFVFSILQNNYKFTNIIKLALETTFGHFFYSYDRKRCGQSVNYLPLLHVHFCDHWGLGSKSIGRSNHKSKTSYQYLQKYIENVFFAEVLRDEVKLHHLNVGGK